MLELYVQGITLFITIVVSLFIVFWPSSDANEDSWAKKFHENEHVDDPFLKLIIPPKAFVHVKKHGFSKALVNKLMQFYKRGKLFKSSSQQMLSSASLDECFEHAALNGIFHLKYIPIGVTPLICFVNSKSGGHKGQEVMNLLKQHLNPQCQVFDLAKISPEKILTAELCAIPGLIVLVCGGDGTVGWIMSSLMKLNANHTHTSTKVILPPLCILPLGTGNDLSFALGWGNGYQGETSVLTELMMDIIEPNLTNVTQTLYKIMKYETPYEKNLKLDRNTSLARHCPRTRSPFTDFNAGNTATIKQEYKQEWNEMTDEAEDEDGMDGICMDNGSNTDEMLHGNNPTSSQSLKQVLVEEKQLDLWNIKYGPNTLIKGSKLSNYVSKRASSLTFSNYFSIGVDAQIVYNFHYLRESSPAHFLSQWGNKLWYGIVGGAQIISKDCQDLSSDVILYINDEMIPIDASIEGIIICNIKSYGGGSHLWQCVDTDASIMDQATNTANGGNAPAATALEQMDKVMNYVVSDIQELVDNTCHHIPALESMGLLSSSGGNSGNNSGGTSVKVDDCKVHPPVVYPPGTNPAHFHADAMDDGTIEILGVTGSFHLAQIKSHLALPIKLGQIPCRDGTRIRIITNKSFPMQIDGEPWIEQACVLDITLGNPIPVLTCVDAPISPVVATPSAHSGVRKQPAAANYSNSGTPSGIFYEDDDADAEDATATTLKNPRIRTSPTSPASHTSSPALLDTFFHKKLYRDL